MPYVVDFTKDPKTLVLELLNSENGTNLSEADFDILPVAPIATKPGFNTELPLKWKTTDDMIGLVKVYYNRIDLAVLFSLTGITLKEVMLDLVDGSLVLNDKFFDELFRRYGVRCTAADFEIKAEAGGFKLYARDANLAYSGSMGVGIEKSLFTRVFHPILDGFSLIDPSDIRLMLVDQEIDLFAFPARFDTTKASAELITRGIDCSDFQSFLELNADGSFKYFTELTAQLAAYGVPAFSNSTSANKAIKYAVASYADSIKSYTYVVVIENVVSPTMTGRVMLHYTVAS